MASTLNPSMSPLYCAISGQVCTDPVLTPSGYICERRFLLSKLVDTNGLDPLVDNGRELKESDLISIQRSLVTAPPPRLPSVTSFSNLLEMMQQEHDALLLELYDTRKALEETRMELSQALYQNDAAVRVVARLSLERDEARRLLSQWNSDPSSRRPIPSDDDPHSRNLSNPPAVVAEEDHPMEEVVGETQPLVTTAPSPCVPQEDLQNLIAAWKELSDQRRQTLKKRKHELTTEHPIQIHENSKAEVKSVHKSNKPGMVALSTIRHPTTQNEYVLSAGIDKTLVIYNQTTQNILQTLMNSNGKHFTALDVVSASSSLLIGAVDASGMLQVFKEVSKQEDNALSTYELLDAGLQLVTEQDDGGDAEIVAISFHPFGRYLLVSLNTGKVVIVKVMEHHLLILTSFQTQQAESGTTSITCSALHPDGLIFSVGKSDGSIEIWDLKTLSLASTLETPSDVEKTPVTSLAFSENGYHFASSFESGEVMVWDLRKVSLITTLNAKTAEEDQNSWVTNSPIRSVAFDPRGKYLAYCSDAGDVRITTVKEWGKTAMFAADLSVAKKAKEDGLMKTFIAWGPQSSYIVTGCNKSRFIKLVYDTVASEAK